jgi:hypothetical protein
MGPMAVEEKVPSSNRIVTSVIHILRNSQARCTGLIAVLA